MLISEDRYPGKRFLFIRDPFKKGIPMEITYKHHQEAWNNHYSYLTDLIIRKNLKKICEIGGGANPLLPLSFIEQHDLEYVVLDVSAEELSKAPEGYSKVMGDITSDNIDHLGKDYDLIFSKMLAEHVMHGITFHQNIKQLLKPGGMAFHFFPTLYSLPFTLNKIVPESFSLKLLSYISKERNNMGNHGKFPAYYSMCYGPTKKQINILQQLGYRVDAYTGFFGHDYFKNMGMLHWISNLTTRLLLKYPIARLTSYSYVVLTKI